MGSHDVRRHRPLGRLAGRALLALVPLLGLTPAAAGQDALESWRALYSPELQDALLARELGEADLREIIEIGGAAAPEDVTAAWFVFTALQQLSALLDGDPSTTAERVELLDRGRAAVAPMDAGYAAGLALEEARLLNAMGQDRRARDVCREALDGLPEDDSWRAWVLRQLGEQARFRRDVGAAREWLEAAARACEPGRHRGHTRLETMILVSRASVLLDLGLTDLAAADLDAAGAALERAREAAAQGDRLPVYTELEYECARVAQESALGRQADAIARGRAAIERFEGSERPGLATLREKIRTKVGFVELDAGNAAAAAADFAAVLRQPLAEAWDAATADMWLAHLRLVDGDVARAAEHVAGARERFDALAAQPDSRVPGRELAVVAALELRLALRTGAPFRGQLSDLERAFETMIAEWREAPHRLGGVAFLRYTPARLVVEALIDGAFAVDEPRIACERAVGYLHHAQSAGTLVADLSGGASIPAFDPRRLPEGTGLLVYFDGPERLHAFALHDGAARHAEAPGDARRWIEFTRLVATPPAHGGAARRERLAELGAALRAELVPDALLEVVEPSQVVAVVGRDMLADLPLEALPGRGGEPLGVELALEHWYSLPLGPLLDAAAAPALEPAEEVGAAALVLAPIHGPLVRERWPHLAPLPLDEEDHEALTRTLAPWPVEVVAGGDATLGALTRALAGRRPLLHLLTHGVTVAERERSAALVLAPGPSGTTEGELLFSEDVESWSAPPLVVLSACASGSGPARSGDAGASHLGGAFLRAGARAVVLAEFALPTGPTLALVRTFQTALARGASPAEALRQARSEVRAKPGGDDPYHFALLHVVGAGHLPIYPAQPAARGWARPSLLGAGTLALILFGLVAIRARATREARVARSDAAGELSP